MTPVRELLLRGLRLPPRPELPAADPALVRVFNPAPGYLPYLRLSWLAKQIGALAGLVSGLFFLREGPDSLPWRNLPPGSPITAGTIEMLFGLLEAGAWLGFVVQAAGSFALVRLDWELRWYLISDRSLRVREGLLRLNEKTMTFANIQNVSIHQGPLQRLFGISDLEVRSAGGGDEKQGQDKLHAVWFRGVSDAETIRDTVLSRLQASREEGQTGRTDTAVVTPRTPAERLADAARLLLDETRALRAAAPPRPRAQDPAADAGTRDNSA